MFFKETPLPAPGINIPSQPITGRSTSKSSGSRGKLPEPFPAGLVSARTSKPPKSSSENNIEHPDMKTKLNPSQNCASALLVTLFLITILAVSIAGYLAYANQQTRLGVRAQTWNMALAVSEAGVEEGLEQLNNNYANLSSDGWTGSGTTYSISRSLGNGNSYTVSIEYSNTTSPSITARAFVNPPSLAQNAPTVFFAATGADTSTSANVTRAVRCQTSRGSLFLAAMVARHKIDMNGNNVRTDSFDSGDPAKSNFGQYTPAKAGDYGDVASN